MKNKIMQVEEGPTSVDNTLRGAVVQIASPQTSFGVRLSRIHGEN